MASNSLQFLVNIAFGLNVMLAIVLQFHGVGSTQYLLFWKTFKHLSLDQYPFLFHMYCSITVPIFTFFAKIAKVTYFLASRD